MSVLIVENDGVEDSLSADGRGANLDTAARVEEVVPDSTTQAGAVPTFGSPAITCRVICKDFSVRHFKILLISKVRFTIVNPVGVYELVNVNIFTSV